MSYLPPTVEEKDDSVMTDGRIFLSQHVKNYLRTYKNIQINATGQGDKNWLFAGLSLFEKNTIR